MSTIDLGPTSHTPLVAGPGVGVASQWALPAVQGDLHSSFLGVGLGVYGSPDPAPILGKGAKARVDPKEPGGPGLYSAHRRPRARREVGLSPWSCRVSPGHPEARAGVASQAAAHCRGGASVRVGLKIAGGWQGRDSRWEACQGGGWEETRQLPGPRTAIVLGLPSCSLCRPAMAQLTGYFFPCLTKYGQGAQPKGGHLAGPRVWDAWLGI
jgi:hypothetical protein